MSDSTSTSPIKICYIGGGSKNWAHNFMTDLALSEHLNGELTLFDIDQEAAEKNTKVFDTIFAKKNAVSQFSCRAEHNLEAALENSDFVIMSIEPGPMEARYADLVVAEEHGIIQPVGDTSGPGGALRALRCLPVYTEYAHKIMAVCPDAWVINYTNPMTLCVAALYAAEPNIKAFGCCHEVFGTQSRLADIVAKHFNIEKPERQEIEVDITGVNHFTWATAARWKGHDLFPLIEEFINKDGFWDDHTASAKEREDKEEYFSSDGLIAFDLFRQFGVLGAAGDRHLVEFMPYYLASKESLQRMSVNCTPYEYRIRSAELKLKHTDKKLQEEELSHSGEEAVEQIEALLGIRPMVTNINIPNRGQNADLPQGAVVESYARFAQGRLEPIVCGAAPAPVNSLIRRIADEQSALLEAINNEDAEAVFQALLPDPLLAHKRPEQIRIMWNAMLQAAKQWIPAWAQVENSTTPNTAIV